MRIKKVYASSVAALDSNVLTGGGTDDTAALQAVLDEAKDGECGIWLIMDGAALVKGLDVYSNTTIECLSRACGFFQIEDSNRAILSNADWSFENITTRNVTLVGGTYNQDCLRQKHDIDPQPGTREYGPFPRERFIFGLEFYGVEYLTIRDLTVRNFRTFAVTVGNFRNVLIENVWLELPDRMYAQNQDGFHFWGPGRFLTIKNVGGTVGDDFMNIGPDEHDGKSAIEDVIVDGVFLENADQGIRLLTHRSGYLDRVTVRNVSGTYRSFGFYINCWFTGPTYGDFRNLFFENIDLRQDEPVYDYHQSFLFSVGGNVQSLTCKNIRLHNPRDDRPLFELGLPFCDTSFEPPEDNRPEFKNLFIDGLTILEDSPAAKSADYIQVFDRIERAVLRNVFIVRDDTVPADGHLIAFRKNGEIGSLYMDGVRANGFKSLIERGDRIRRLTSVNVINEK